MEKPRSLFGREAEWRALSSFVKAAGPGLRLAVVYGRRRQGKSYLLRRLAEATGGLYFMPLEEGRNAALRRFADVVAESLLGLPAGGLSFDSWEAALRTAVSALGREARQPAPTLVLDELPYLLAHSPEIPSVLQRLYDESREDPAAPQVRVVVCGSALSVMADLLSGSRALRGRATVDLCLKPFTYRQAAEFWRATDPEVAFHLHAIFGGTPGYRDLVAGSPAGLAGLAELGEWLGSNVLNPAHALYGEADYLLREDPRLADRALYYSTLTAVAGGATTPTRIGAVLGRPAQSLAYPISVLEGAGFVNRVEDVLLQRRGRLVLTDPIVRFHRLITAPRQPMLEEGRSEQVWRTATETFRASILGPHFEQLAREWTVRHGDTEGLREPVGAVGPTTVNDPAGRTAHELDVVGLAADAVPRSRNPRVVVLGEAKHSARPRTVADLHRLERLRGLLTARGVDAAGAQLVLFAGAGVDDELAALAATGALLVVDLSTLYGA